MYVNAYSYIALYTSPIAYRTFTFAPKFTITGTAGTMHVQKWQSPLTSHPRTRLRMSVNWLYWERAAQFCRGLGGLAGEDIMSPSAHHSVTDCTQQGMP